MAKGISIKFKSYKESIPKILELLKLEKELQKYDKVVLKPTLNSPQQSTNLEFVEEVLKFCISHKNPVAEVFIAEGSDGYDTEELFDELGYRKLAEKYNVGLVDLNTADVEEIELDGFLNFSKIKYPSILRDSFIISLPAISEDEEILFFGSLANMLGAYPSEHYSGFFTKAKKKIKNNLKNSIHDILMCKMPQFAIMDLSSEGIILAGIPLEMDKQAAHYFDFEWKDVPYLRLINDSFSEDNQQKGKVVEEAAEEEEE